MNCESKIVRRESQLTGGLNSLSQSYAKHKMNTTNTAFLCILKPIWNTLAYAEINIFLSKFNPTSLFSSNPIIQGKLLLSRAAAFIQVFYLPPFL